MTKYTQGYRECQDIQEPPDEAKNMAYTILFSFVAIAALYLLALYQYAA